MAGYLFTYVRDERERDGWRGGKEITTMRRVLVVPGSWLSINKSLQLWEGL